MKNSELCGYALLLGRRPYFFVNSNTMVVKKENFHQILLHLGLILIFIASEIYMIFTEGSNAGIVDLAAFYGLDILGFYTATYGYVPFVIRHFRHILIRGALFLAWPLFIALLMILLTAGLLAWHDMKYDFANFWRNYYACFWRGLQLFAMAFVFWYARQSIRKLREANQKEARDWERKEREFRLENALLRAQVNPHLLYNTLSGVYLSLIDKAPEAARIVQVLSDIMKYSLEASSTDQEHTVLRKEITFITKMVTLQRQLYYNSLHLNMDIDLTEEILDRQVASMIFTNIIDNVFKHGVINDPAHTATIHFTNSDNELHLRVSNLVRDQSRYPQNGLGMDNTYKRLDKYYPGRYRLNEHITNNYYHLNLLLTL